MWIPAFACPACRSDLGCIGGAWLCSACGARFTTSDGLFQFVLPGRVALSAPFLEQYRSVRRADGHSSRSREQYQALPSVRMDDPNLAEWRIRQESFRTLCRLAVLAGSTSQRVLDLGGGNGWLSNRLACFGHLPVAVDLNDDADDGLLACRTYARSVAAVQADFNALPFAPGQFDVVVLNAALHYSPNPEGTLLEADRMLRPGGALAVMDSPIFESESDGEAMVWQQTEALRHRHGVVDPVHPGVGYLTFAALERIAARLGRCARFVASHGSVTWRVRRMWSRRRIHRAPAAFGVWVAR
jgi:SAM-dependent methyltransferase